MLLCLLAVATELVQPAAGRKGRVYRDGALDRTFQRVGGVVRALFLAVSARLCRFAGTPSPSLLKRRLEGEEGCSRVTVSPAAISFCGAHPLRPRRLSLLKL